ncbi:malate dehydrogenase [Bacillus subtilis subsp. subtilis]|uniref:Malate dehydrogenase n=3 Tax=Bacillus subtilis subsp. subtilis TaxID=135461 RepID=MDH_BACSU|nr:MULTISPECIES: malate dehydrogenase [Bacillales]NP_390790.1 malate dehydrogenase (NAD-dependent) [Bacillus subtilis subsp. subtilis str. 168]P49814.3 RecName: Full=Malate dehydrogenase; AltName: Full=Vegetative protein 69; Short=VEG69 [Bacillus subtilis subsp. subtilis str. 168]MDP4110736.1 malate dehydrogenase [Bacillota bacterium]BAM54160.1 malate dehydrogenase [Bacillus subtilis BEST7613]AAA96343.1 malate dehydrogenase [Bacillus subtilis subsp. subtilis str. SMY]AAC00347.1 malate dehydro
MGNTRKKVSVIGAGFTGATTAFLIAQKELADVVLVDIPQLENPTKGKALDMLEASPVQGFDAKITGTSNYEDTAGSDIVVITAGIARKPGMSRDDLVSTNEKIMRSVTQEIVKYSPDSIIVVLTNPVDAMTYAVYKESGFPKERVIGQSGVLDTARFRTFVAEELNLSVKDVTGFVLGGHGDDMVPLVRYSYAGGIPLETLIPKERIDAIVERTRKGGGEIVNLLGNGSAYYAPAASLTEMVEAILKDQRRVLPTIAYLEGEYGYEGIYLGVPTIVGGNGLEQIIELELTDYERAQLNKSVESVKNVMKVLS